MVCFYDVVSIATQAEFIPQLKQRVFFHLFYKGERIMLFRKHPIKVIADDVDQGLFGYALDFLKNLAALLP